MIRDESGMTIAELAVGSALMLLIAGAALNVLGSTQRVARYTSTQSEAVDAARIAMARITNEVRDAATIHPPTGTCPEATCLTLERALPSGGLTGVRYRYDVAARILYRATGDPLLGTWSTEDAVATAVANGAEPMFCRSGACAIGSGMSVTVAIVIDAGGGAGSDEPVRLQSVVSPRNR